MNSDQREESVFAEVIARPRDDRAAYLAAVCGNDSMMLARIWALIAAHESPESLNGSALAVRHPKAGEEKPGDTIGRYKLLQKIGEGGCGVVWMADQEDPVRRRIALKVIKLGMDTKAVVARFDAERQALALMDHPNIAKVLDGGATETGRPYFVMELVRGVPITRYCDENHLTLIERLELFINVCHAVQHAHQKGIIHRDLKPSNILVSVHDGAATPKIIDFGIAKATQGRLTRATVFTAFDQFIGTPLYMSPEQADMSSLDVDTRSDIYSLGVLLYELLTGKPPVEPEKLTQGDVVQIRNRIRDDEPPRPSARLRTLSNEEQSTIARLRNTAPAQLSLILRGDLDWIVMRCIEKDRTRRYETANGLAMDIRRYLRNEPVIARPPSTGYLLQKLIRRHRVGFAATMAIFAVAVIGAIVSIEQAIRARQAERAAERSYAVEVGLRHTAEANEQIARRRAYAADMNLVQQALTADNLGRARELLWSQVPEPGQRELRGWEWRHLWQSARSDRHDVLEVRAHGIWDLASSADGAWLAIGDIGGGMSVRNLRLHQQFRLPAGKSHVRAAFSPREPLLAVSSRKEPADGRDVVELWNVATRRLERRLDLAGRCAGLFFSAEGDTLLIPTGGVGLTRWSLTGTGEVSTTPAIVTPEYAGYSIAATADLGLVALPAARKSDITVIDLRNGNERWTAPAAGELVAALAFSPDGKLLASGACYIDPVIRLWDLETAREVGRLEGHRAWVSALVFWPDGRTLASASADQTIRIWDVPSRRLLRTLRGHQAEIYRLALHANSETLLSGAKDGTVCRWEISELVQPRNVDILPEQIAAWRFNRDSSILTLNPAGVVARWSGPGYQQQSTLMKVDARGVRDGSFNRGLDALLYVAVFAADRPLVAIGSTSGVVQVWDFERGALANEFKIGDAAVIPLEFLKGGGRLLVHTSDDRGTYREWDLGTGRETAAWGAPEGAWQPSLVVSPDERHALAVGHHGKSVSRDLETGFTRSFELPITRAEGPRFSPDGRWLAVPSHLGMAKLWRFPELDTPVTLSGFILGVHSVAFSPDGSRLAIASNGNEAVKLWDLEGRLPLLTLEGRGSRFSRTAFSPDGASLGSVTRLGQLHLWRAPEWKEIERAESARLAATLAKAP